MDGVLSQLLLFASWLNARLRLNTTQFPLEVEVVLCRRCKIEGKSLFFFFLRYNRYCSNCVLNKDVLK